MYLSSQRLVQVLIIALAVCTTTQYIDSISFNSSNQWQRLVLRFGKKIVLRIHQEPSKFSGNRVGYCRDAPLNGKRERKRAVFTFLQT